MMKILLQILRSVFFLIAAGISFMAAYNCNDNEMDCRFAFEEKYGGEAFTGIQNAIAQETRNTFNIQRNTQESFSFLFLVTGVACIALAVPTVPTTGKSE